MNIQDIRKGDEANYVLFVVHSSAGGYFWREMRWSEGHWHPAVHRSIINFETKSACLSDMRAEVPQLMEGIPQVGNSSDEMLFRVR